MKTFLQKKIIEISIALYERMISNFNVDSKVLGQYALLLMQLKQFEQALLIFDQAFKKGEVGSDVFVNWLQAHLNLKNYSQVLVGVEEVHSQIDQKNYFRLRH